MQLRRAVRHLCLDRNPLRRRADRVEAWLAMLLALTCLFVGPVAAWRTGHAVYCDELLASRLSAHEHVRVSAVLEQDAVLTYAGSDNAVLVQLPVWARWSRPDGTRNRGKVIPGSPGPAGTVVPVWIDTSGNLTAPPRTKVDVRRDGVQAGLLVAVGVFAFCGGARMLLRRLVDRRRMVWWQREWTSVEPRWTHRR
jgi:hypothetical protein